jgi:hypothetical protein
MIAQGWKRGWDEETIILGNPFDDCLFGGED